MKTIYKILLILLTSFIFYIFAGSGSSALEILILLIYFELIFKNKIGKV